MKKLTLLFAPFLLVLLIACNKKADFEYLYYLPEEYQLISQRLNLPEVPDNYSVDLPDHIGLFGLSARPVDRDKAILGRVLFYDKSLSKDGKISCASCHAQSLAFSDNKVKSDGVFDRQTERNSFPLGSVLNFAAYYGTDINGPSALRFFWDNRAETAAEQNIASLTNPQEMDMHLDEVVAAVEAQPFYKPLFKKAYPNSSITSSTISDAISNFVNAIGSYKSKFDEAADQTMSGSFESRYDGAFNGFTAEENLGKSLYMDNCASCHSPGMGRPLLFNASNGLDADFSADLGVGKWTANYFDKGTFKVPTLRNIALTAPYMHDGRFKTLEEVIDHYSTGIQNAPNLHPNLKNPNGTPKRMDFGPSQKQALIAFLHTLTDQHLLVDARFSDPFKQ